MSSAAGARLNARWRVTPAQVRALLLGVLLVGFGVVLRRPDAVVLGAPLLVVAVWATATRPTAQPVVHAGPRHTVLREGQATTWTTTVLPCGGVEEVGVSLLRTPHTRYRPTSRAVAGAFPNGAATRPVTRAVEDGTFEGELRLDVTCQSTRWGSRALGPATVALTGAFGGYTWEPEPVSSAPLPTVPLPDTFSARVAVPRPDGLVGRSRSHHHGDGGELAEIRPFRFGDRLRRVHWPVSARTGELHVTATHADQDSEVLLLVDAMHDLGAPADADGPGGGSSDGSGGSSLDNAVRAAGAVAEHYLRAGDRVGLLVLGARNLPRVASAAGSNHLRRVLDVLARVQVADSTVSDEKRLRGQLRHQVGAGTLVVVLTPAISPEVLAHTVALTRRGISVVTVDTLPAEVATPDLSAERLEQVAPGAAKHLESARLAWRIRLMEREREMLRAREAGAPIVPWAGPGTLDLVLRDLGRRARAPRVVSR